MAGHSFGISANVGPKIRNSQDSRNQPGYALFFPVQKLVTLGKFGDRVWGVYFDPQQNINTIDEAPSLLDVVLLLLMGAVDATARVAHAVLRLESKPDRAGWQKQDWLSKVAKAAPPLAALFQEGTETVHFLTILRLLRNSIHGKALTALGVKGGQQSLRTLVGLPKYQQTKLLESFDALGGTDNWGVEQLFPNQVHANPGVLLEQLLPRILEMLNKIVDATPIEELAHVSPQSSDLQPFGGRDSVSCTEMRRQSIRWQVGL